MVDLLEFHSWVAEAVCAQVDPDLWYPDHILASGPAKALCATCPVQAECLTAALDQDEQYGVWGGTTPRDRRKLRKGVSR